MILTVTIFYEDGSLHDVAVEVDDNRTPSMLCFEAPGYDLEDSVGAPCYAWFVPSTNPDQSDNVMISCCSQMDINHYCPLHSPVPWGQGLSQK